MLKTFSLNNPIREKWYIHLETLKRKYLLELLFMLGFPYAFFGVVPVMAFASARFLIPAAPWRDYLEYSFRRLGRAFSRVMRVRRRNYTVGIICNELVITENLIFFEVNKWALGILSFWLSKLILRASTLTHRLVGIGLKINLTTSCRILVSVRSTCLFVEANTARINAHLLNNDIGVCASQKLFCKLWVALEVHISSLATLTFEIQTRQKTSTICIDWSLKWLERALNVLKVSTEESLIRESLRHPSPIHLFFIVHTLKDSLLFGTKETAGIIWRFLRVRYDFFKVRNNLIPDRLSQSKMRESIILIIWCLLKLELIVEIGSVHSAMMTS